MRLSTSLITALGFSAMAQAITDQQQLFKIDLMPPADSNPNAVGRPQISEADSQPFTTIRAKTTTSTGDSFLHTFSSFYSSLPNVDPSSTSKGENGGQLLKPVPAVVALISFANVILL
ncbi:uncharacterized protein CANTADRAFT_119296 [Suhomyces tanzawaensis NRRL Y-17324]|uniref:Uncharacterized protein n=1 Tax=Suhomyces tanzawaensis NRRL Y-17324 TaxID=984487 RepID=A0A1E4SQE8_9ASCO|nr:uncharacterized protein CANTADRAFT_119296 [Suhomyces tanzawaensis NRRL Y-17324]ODV81731.1 hypothetical protein CANTADRAFT_119296 [Suhomyces tanzawaensis NRRL Y-17324]